MGASDILCLQVGSRKIVLFLAWMIRQVWSIRSFLFAYELARTSCLDVVCHLQGCGLLPDKYFIMAARRLSASMDIEAEMYRFDSTFEAEKEKFSMMELPMSDREKQAAVAVDALSTCCLGMLLGAEVLCCMCYSTGM